MAQTTERDDIEAAPLLVVEVLSPSTRGRDLTDKRRIYAARGIPFYWQLDPVVPDLRVLELAALGEYVEVAYAAGTEHLDLRRPFPVRLSPGELAG